MQPCTHGQIDEGIGRAFLYRGLRCAWNAANDIPLFEYLEFSDKTCPATTQDAFPISKGDSPLRHQNQPPDGTRPLRRRYVTRLP
jgi:hypothetical protein